MKNVSLGLKEALAVTLEHIKPMAEENIPLSQSTGRIVASDLFALVDSPSIDSSRKDGYAVVSREIAGATPEKPVLLKMAGNIAAGERPGITVKPGTAVRVLTGARIPAGADAVVAEEFVKRDGKNILVMNTADRDQNILRRGRDVESRTCIIREGRRISPGLIGLIAAAGHSVVPVFKNPTVAIAGTGDEIVPPGEPLPEGKVYASNIMTISAWCTRYGMKTRMAVVRDDIDTMSSTLQTLSNGADAVITSGGAWKGERDLVVQTLEGLGWQECFHHIRIGPGKAVGFGMVDRKPVFILPGGPPSNLTGFLQIALPGLLALAGHSDPGLPRVHARLAADLEGRERDWTRFFYGKLSEGDGFPVFHPLHGSSRLRDMAEAEALASIPEGQEYCSKGSMISVQLLK